MGGVIKAVGLTRIRHALHITRESSLLLLPFS